MKREQIINKIYDKIRDDLLHALLLYWEEDDANKYPLVDHLSSGNDISTGRDEIDNLIEQIEIEDLIDAILALPLDIPKTKEINAIAHRVYKDAYNPDGCVEDAFKYGMKTAIDEIIKRNRVINRDDMNER